MKKGIIGKKLGMTQIFDEVGNVIPVMSATKSKLTPSHRVNVWT